ncbi:hypothetical protein E4U58_007516 [Claviceps cyperi]|nr:hypothetical protein E4U58_007516 [Claviceps cyperi]
MMRQQDNVAAKDRKSPLTGSGRAWREEEESYLLQSRLKKTPYKHIAAQLNKTELACRLHYHQLSRGNARRKRAGSCSSDSSDTPTRGRTCASSSPVYRGDTRSLSPSVVSSPYLLNRSVTSDGSWLPGIMSLEGSPRLPSMMPRFERSGYAQSHYSQSDPRSAMSTPDLQHSVLPSPVLPYRFGRPASAFHSATPPPRLDTAWRPPRSSPPLASVHTASQIELPRLGAIYERHKNAFWGVVANEYGMNASPAVLEQAWRSGECCQYGKCNQSNHSGKRLITPVASPDKDVTRISSIIDDDSSSRYR